jgi:flagellar assembly protein FliH
MSHNGLIKRQAFRLSEQLRPSHAAPPKPAAPAVAIPAEYPSFVAPVPKDPILPPEPAISPKEIERIKEEARTEGLALGRKQGQQEVEKAARAELAALAAMVAKVSSAWEAERDRMQEALADFAFVCANRLLGDALRDPGMAAAAVRSALAACEGWQQMTLEVHASDLALIRGVVDQDPALSQKVLRVFASEAVQVGGCRIGSNEGSLDARFEVQMAQLSKQLDAHRAAWKAQP